MTFKKRFSYYRRIVVGMALTGALLITSFSAQAKQSDLTLVPPSDSVFLIPIRVFEHYSMTVTFKKGDYIPATRYVEVTINGVTYTGTLKATRYPGKISPIDMTVRYEGTVYA